MGIYPGELRVPFMTFHNNSPPCWIWPREVNTFFTRWTFSSHFRTFLVKKKMENTQQLYTCITLLRLLLLHSLHDYDVKRLNARSDGLEDVNERRRFFSLFFFINLDESFSIQLPKKFVRTHWARLNKRDRVLKNQNWFLREFFTAVVVKVADKLPDNPIIDIGALMTQLAI